MHKLLLLIVALTLATGLVGVNAASALGPIDLLTDANIRIDGAAAGDDAGISVSEAGDVNGDGLSDVIIGADKAGNNGRPSSGSAYVIFGRPIPSTVDLDSLGTAGFRIDGDKTTDYAGTSVSGAGDVNGDGFDDVIIGGQSAVNSVFVRSGVAYVVYGGTAPGNVDLGSLGDAGFQINGVADNDRAGRSVSGAGDVNGDGFDDVIVGAYQDSNNGRSISGAAYVIYGHSDPATVNLVALDSSIGFRIDGAAAEDWAGYSVSGAGDVNVDGLDDVIVGAPHADSNGRSMSGTAYVIYGRVTPAGVDLASLGAAGFRVDGAVGGDETGFSVSGAGDVNGDGRDDMIIGADEADNNGRDKSGSAWVIYGGASLTDIDLADPLGTDGFRIDGAKATHYTGASVSDAGDVNGDGRADVIVGAFFASNNGRSTSGSAYVVYGQASPADVDLASLGSAGFRIDGAAAGDWAGYSVSGAGDTDGDGLDDMVVGAVYASNNGRVFSGSAYILYPFRPLAIQSAGTGHGSVVGSPAGIDCGPRCFAGFEIGSQVTLTATPAPGSVFAGWSGACSGSDPTCVVTVDEASSVTASFDLVGHELTVTLAGTGQGSVSSSPAGIDCGTTCDFTFDHGEAVALAATPVAGSTFTGWSGACSGSDPACLVTMDEVREVAATFTKDEIPGPTVPANPPNNTAIFDLATGKLKVRLKCGGQYRPKCLKLAGRAVTGKGRRARVMSNAVTVKKVKAGKWKRATLKVKPKFRQKVRAMGKKKAKTLWVRIKVTWKKKGRKRARTVHHRYRVLVRE